MAAEAKSATAPTADSEAWLAQNPLDSFATAEDAIHAAYKAGQLHHVNAEETNVFPLNPDRPMYGEYRIVQEGDGWRWEYHDQELSDEELDYGTVMDSRDEALEGAIKNVIDTVDESLLGVVDRLQAAKSS